jgi:RNA polymerase sigma factor (sigma-70 family)
MARKPRKAQPDPKNVPFDQLAAQWKPLVHRFASWNVRGYDYDDLFQELMITLRNAQARFQPGKGFAFSTYLHQAFTNRVGSLHHAMSDRKRRIPPDKQVSIEAGQDSPSQGVMLHHNMVQLDQGMELVDLTYGMSKNAQMVAEYLVGYENHALSEEQVADGVAELKQALRGGN